MDIFISWSGPRSQEMATFLNSWLPNVIQELKPFYSPEIPKGDTWLSEIKAALDRSSFGLVLVTKRNTTSPWLNFEAGAISKNVGTAKVATILLDKELETSELGPLSQFQLTRVLDDEILRLLTTINASISRPLKESQVEALWDNWKQTFWTNWEIISKIPYEDHRADNRSNSDKIDDILSRVKNLERCAENAQTQICTTIREVNECTNLELSIFEPPSPNFPKKTKIGMHPIELPDGSTQYSVHFPGGAKFKTWEGYEIATGKKPYKYQK